MLLLDTHILIWLLRTPERLSTHVAATLEPAAGFAISGITLWEIAMLVSKGRVDLGADPAAFLGEALSGPVGETLPITSEVAVRSTQLGDNFPKDPADQIIVATALVHGLTLVTADERIRRWGGVPIL